MDRSGTRILNKPHIFKAKYFSNYTKILSPEEKWQHRENQGILIWFCFLPARSEVTTQRQARAKGVTCHEAQLQQQKDQEQLSLFLWHRGRQEVTLRDKWCALNFQNIPIPPLVNKDFSAGIVTTPSSQVCKAPPAQEHDAVLSFCQLKTSVSKALTVHNNKHPQRIQSKPKNQSKWFLPHTKINFWAWKS